MRYRFGEFELDEGLYALSRLGEPVALKNKPLDLLLHLLRHRDRVVPKRELFAHLWPDTVVAPTSLTTAINTLRVALGDDGTRQVVIQTCHARGYRFVAEVELVDPVPLAPPTSAPAPTPGRLRDLFVGRKEILGEIDEALRAACSREPRVLLVAGEMGIGKSRCADRAGELATKRGMRVVIGRAEAESGAPAYWPWVRILRSLCLSYRPEELARLLGRGAPEVAQMVGGLEERLPDLGAPAPLEPAQARFRLFDSITRFLRASAEELPLLIALEDLHCADQGSLRLLRFVAGSLSDERVLVLATERQSDLQRRTEVVETISELMRSPAVRRLELPPLSREDVSEYVTRAAGAVPPGPRVDQLFERTGGNPFFLSHLVLSLSSESGVDALLSSVEAERRLPADLREAVAQQIAGLPADCAQLLGVASVFGRDFAWAPLAETCGLDAGPTLDALQSAVDLGVVQPHPERPDHFRFAHVLVRDALYERLIDTERRQLHAKIAGVLETYFGTGRDAHASELAHHFGEAAAVGWAEPALRYAERAAEWATRHTAHERAVAHYQQALELVGRVHVGDDARRCDLLVALATAQCRTGMRSAARRNVFRAAELARIGGDANRLAQAALALDPGFLSIEVGIADEELIRLIREALAGIDASSPLHGPLLARFAPAVHHAEDGGAMARVESEVGSLSSKDDGAADLHALIAKYWLLWMPGDLERRLDLGPRIVERAEFLGERENALVYRLMHMTSLMQAGERAAVDRLVPRFTSSVRALRQAQSDWYVFLLDGMVALLDGDFDRAQRSAEKIAEFSVGIDDANAEQARSAQLAFAGSQLGQADAQVDPVAEMVRRFPGHRMWQAFLPILYADGDSIGDAQQRFAVLAANDFADFPVGVHWLASLAMAADACCAVAAEQKAPALYALLEPHHDQFPVVGFSVVCWGSAARLLGRLLDQVGDFEGSEGFFEEALLSNARIGARPWLAHTQHQYAHMLMRREAPGDGRRARQLLELAHQAAREMGMVLLAERVEALATR